jgi:hypothetical protein
MGTTIRRLHATIISVENDAETPDSVVADEVMRLYSPEGTGYDYAWVEKITQVDQIEFVEGETPEQDNCEDTRHITFLDLNEETGKHFVAHEEIPAEERFYVKDRLVPDPEASLSNFGPDAHPIPEGWPDK